MSGTLHAKGIWCPWAALLCPACHNSDPPKLYNSPTFSDHKVYEPPWHKAVPCDKCATPCWFHDDVAIPALMLRAVSEAQPLDGNVTGNMWQTGGMCPAAALKCEGDPRLIVVTALDADLCVGVYADVAAWDDFDEDKIDMFTFGADDITGAAQKVLDTFNAEAATCPGCAGAGCWDCTLPVGPNTCESCAVYVPTGEHCGNERADGTSEYLCPDCYTPVEA